MIATISGTVSEHMGDMVVIDASGVGYGLLVTAEDFGKLPLGTKTKLYVYEHIRENSHDLFGFSSTETKLLFEKLLDVNGVGPRMALNMLSIGSSSDLIRAITTGDTKYIQTAQGVGKRVAERVVVDLKDKLGVDGIELGASGLLQSEQSLLKDEAVSALVSLGYSAQDAAQALEAVDPALPSEERVKLALRGQS